MISNGIDELKNKPLSEWGGSVINCSCGRTHTIATTDIVAGSGKVSEIGRVMASVLPVGSAAVMLSTPEQFEKFGSAAERFLRRSGYKIKRQLDLENLTPDDIESYILEEDLRAVIIVGSGDFLEKAKYFAHTKKLPSLILATSPDTTAALAPYALVCISGVTKRIAVKAPKVVLCDYDFFANAENSSIAAAFGAVTGKFLAVFDWQFSSVMRGEQFCSHIADFVKEISYSVVKSIKGNEKCNDGKYKTLAEAGLKISALTQTVPPGRLYLSGATALCDCLKMLFCHEARKLKSCGENEFVFSVIAAKIYRQAVSQQVFGFCPPPDNNLRIECLAQYLNIPVRDAALMVSPYPSAEKFKLEMYRLGEYKAELYDKITEVCLSLDESYKIFKRLYSDDGFSLLGYLENSDVSLCLALAPDVSPLYTMLTLLKNVGVLDKYIS